MSLNLFNRPGVVSFEFPFVPFSNLCPKDSTFFVLVNVVLDSFFMYPQHRYQQYMITCELDTITYELWNVRIAKWNVKLVNL